jgi:hypothetical protein
MGAIGLREIAAGAEPAHWNGKAATLIGGLAHDVSILLGVGRQLGSQPRANTSITIMRAPQRGRGQGSTRGASPACGSLMCQTSAARSWRRSVTRNKNRTPVMIRLRLQMLVPLSTRHSWNRRTSSGVTVSGERLSQAANRLQLEMWLRWVRAELARSHIFDHTLTQRTDTVGLAHGELLPE